MLHRPVCAALLMLGLCASAGGARPADDQDIFDAKVVLDRAARAVGTRWGDGVHRLTTRAIVAAPDGASRVLIDSAVSDRLHFEQRFFDGRFFAGWVNGETAWYRTGDDLTMRKLDAAEREALLANQWHVICLDLSQQFSDFTPAGHESFAGVRAIKLSMLDASGQKAAAFFDPQSFIPLGLELHPPSPADAARVSITFRNWSEQDNVFLFHEASVVQGQHVYRYIYTDIDFDRPGYDPFEVPPSIARTP